MNFAYENFDKSTIAAIATPVGNGSVAIIRISGPKALGILKIIFSNPKIETHRATYGKIHDGLIVLDHVLVLYFKAPKSFTGQDVVEIHCHGGHFLQQRILDLVLQKGAKMAKPGEFSYRAYLNDKMDLVQAEAIQQLIFSKSEAARKVSEQQLTGFLSKKIKNFQKQLIDIYALLEAWVDFPEEDLEFRSFKNVIEELEEIKNEMTGLLNTFDEGQKLFSGIQLALLGPPNAGKSSLLNLLLKKERAIVSEIPGTTRDFLQEECVLFGYPIQLIDTAGMRASKDALENLGIDKSKSIAKTVDLNVVVLDISQKLEHSFLSFLNTLDPKKTCIVWNKCDLTDCIPMDLAFPSVMISCKTKANIEGLLEALKPHFALPDKEEVFLTNRRHFEALKHAKESLRAVIRGLQQKVSAEFVCFDVKKALEFLSEIIGQNIQKELLDSIFSQFCLGK
ncbi:MAG: tRNA modification GTPase MnmE [Chlamydiae bacterium]|nr:tRNA modification GTPase MnmE [Chlamydiota bacterium]